MNIENLDTLIKAVCPIYGVSSDGKIDFKPEATAQQKIDAQAIMATNISKLVL